MRAVCFALLFAGALLMPSMAATVSVQKSPASAVARTGKERLSDKGSDEQRVDDCKVPPARRTRPRPTECQ